MKNQETITKAIETELLTLTLDNIQFSDHLTIDDLVDNVDDIESFINDKIQEIIYEQEIVYYSNAMEYLSNNDNSLKESLSLAADMGYTIDTLNSEILATLLYQQELSEELYKIDYSELICLVEKLVELNIEIYKINPPLSEYLTL